MRTTHAFAIVGLCIAATIIACSSDDTDDDPGLSRGGTTQQGGSAGMVAAAGGAAAGMAAGGTLAGGASSGGTSAGGSSAGGSSAGGSSAGGTSGGGGTAGTSVSTAGAGGDASAGAGGTGPTESCTGCARLSVPITLANQQTNFVMAFAAPMDLTGAVVTFRVMTYAGTQGGIMPYVQNGADDSWADVGYDWTNLTDATGWTNVTLDVDAEAAAAVNGFDKTAVVQIGLVISAGSGTGPWANPTVVYVDSVTVELDSSGGAGAGGMGGAAGAGGTDVPWPYDFTSSSAPFSVNAGASPVPNSAVGWVGP